MEMRAMMRKEPGSRLVVMRCHSAVLRVAAMASAAVTGGVNPRIDGEACG